MNAQLSMFEDQTSPDSPNAISSVELQDGHTPCNSPDSLKQNPSGLVPARASRSRRQAKERGNRTSGTSGLIFEGSLKSAGLQEFLESRCRQRLDVDGSMEYELTWKSWSMKSGLPICALRASERPISDSGFTGWPSPNTPSGGPNTPSGGPNTKSTPRHTGGKDLEGVATLCGWPSPRAEDSESCGMRHSRGVADTLTAVASLCGWATPTSRDHKDGGSTLENTPVNALLGRQVQLAGWATLCGQDGPKGGPNQGTDRLPGQVHLVDGTTSISSTAKTGKRGALASEFSGWLMGYPVSWQIAGKKAHAQLKFRKKKV